jgi:heat shock protein HslJ
MKRFALILIALIASLAGAQEPGAELSGITWELQEVTGFDGAVIIVAEPERYTLEFDDGGRIFAGLDCNRGMGSYELDGNELELSGIASTLALCPPDSLYDLYVARLNDVASFELAASQLTLVTKEGAQLKFVPQGATTGQPEAGEPATEEPATEPPVTGQPALTYEAQARDAGATSAFAQQVRNATYRSSALDQDLPLVAGAFEDQAERVSAVLARVAYGDLNGDGVVDAVVLLISAGGGSGSFVELFAVLNEDEMAKPVASTFLGDRVVVQDISVAGPLVRVELLTHGARDPSCCAALSVKQNRVFTGNSLYQLPPAGEYLDSLYDATYPSAYAADGSFTLVFGSYASESLIAGGASRARIDRVAFGDLDRDGQPDAAVIIASNPGAADTAYELHRVVDNEGAALVADTKPLGTGITLLDLRIEAGVVMVRYRDAGGMVVTRTY